MPDVGAKQFIFLDLPMGGYLEQSAAVDVRTCDVNDCDISVIDCNRDVRLGFSRL